MAAKKKAEKSPIRDDYPLQYSDLSSQGKAVINQNMADWGNAKDNLAGWEATLSDSLGRAALSENPTKVENIQKKLDSIRAVGPALKNKNVTLETAANRRVGLAKKAVERQAVDESRGASTGSRLKDVGAGWYFEHHKDLADVASATGVDKDRVITASAVMSLRNDPESEKKAAGALAHLHSTNPTLTFSEKAQKELGLTSSSALYSSLTTEQAAKLSNPKLRKHISGIDQDVLSAQAAGGINVPKAIDVMRGNVHHEQAIDPHKEPKLWSYHNSIKLSVPHTPEHMEYMLRAETALFNPNQMRLDLYGLKESKEGILDPTRTTASDTWEGAISSGQQLESVGRRSPAKTIASDSPFVPSTKTATLGENGKKVSASSDPRVTPENLVHAWHNEAAIRAAKKLGSASGEIVPPTLPQEVGWTEARRIAGKDRTYAKRSTHFAAGHKQPTRPLPTLFD
jgi:hypothetical protein